MLNEDVVCYYVVWRKKETQLLYMSVFATSAEKLYRENGNRREE